MDIRNFFSKGGPSKGDKATSAKAPAKRTRNGAQTVDLVSDEEAASVPKTSKYFAPVKDNASPASRRKKSRQVVDSDDEDDVELAPTTRSAPVDPSPKKKAKVEVPEPEPVDPSDFFGDAKKITRRSTRTPVKKATPSKAAKVELEKDDAMDVSIDLDDDVPLPKTRETRSTAATAAKSPSSSKATSAMASPARKSPARAASSKKPVIVDVEDLGDGTDVDEVAEPAPKKSTPKRNGTSPKNESVKSEPTTPPSKVPAKRRMPWQKDENAGDSDEPAAKKTTAQVKKSPVKPAAVKTEAEDDEGVDENATTPATGGEKKKFNYRDFAAKQSAGPKAPGSKEIPEGAENCLAGLAFVFTGELSSISREDATSLVKRYGGRVTGAPSSRTSYVVLGDEPGESKLRKVKELNIKTLDEDALFDLIKSSPGKAEGAATGKTAAKGKGKTTPATAAKSSVSAVAPAVKNGSQLWTDKYKPQTFKDVIGNKTNIDKLSAWLVNWHIYLANDFKRKGGDEASCFRAALLSGPPGIGKTTSAHLVAHVKGFDVLEFNASDTRNKKALDGVFRESTTSHAVTEYFVTGGAPTAKGKGKQTTTKPGKLQVLIMDEVDGMSGGDRGGSAELIQIIKKSKVPIICICNDRQSPKIKSLANYCLDLRFRRPSALQVEARIKEIAAMEGLELKPNVVGELVSSTSADIRQILNMLSTYRLSSKVMSFDQSKSMAKGWEKNATMTPFDATSRLLGASSLSSSTVADRMELYFQDFSLIPLMVQENYIRCAPAAARHLANGNQKRLELETMSCLSHAAESISMGDLVDNVLRSTNNWSLMPVHAVMSSVRPAFFAHGSQGGQTMFSSWLGQNSKYTKNVRLLREIQSHMRLHISGNKDEVRLNYMSVLAPSLAKPLIKDGADGIDDVIKTMDEYYLTKDDWDAILDLGVGMNAPTKLLSKIPTAVKTSFTRTYNKMSHPTPLITTSVVKSSKKAAAGPVPDLEEAVEPEEVDEGDAGDDEEDDEVDISKDKMIKQKTVKSSAAKGKAKAGGSGSRKKK
ncbi:putative DNA replication factor C subunit Rfc1 [Phlyctochytrium arcticum]|nr:putative DNA replication factor C subunit Rfc1 [Phlyctochytrium arcticum]